jgi:hypothetical protein
MRLDQEELDRIADRLADRVREDIAEVVVPDDGTVCGLDPHRLYTAGQVAERWSVSKDTVYRNLERADWNGQGARFRGIDILRYEGVDVEPARSSPDADTKSPPPSGDGHGTPYDGTLPEI